MRASITVRTATRRRSFGLSALVALALAGAACGPSGPLATPDPTADPTSTPAPAATPGATPTAVPETNLRVTLDLASDRNVVALINDRTGALVGARSGRAAATMSVRWFDAIVENVDGSTIEITWVGLPGDEEIGVDIRRSGAGWTVNVIQAAPPLNSDAEGSDRVLILELDEPVLADDVTVTFTATGAS